MCGVADTSSPLSAAPPHMPQGSADSFTSWGSSTPTGVSAARIHLLPPNWDCARSWGCLGGGADQGKQHGRTTHLNRVPCNLSLPCMGFLKQMEGSGPDVRALCNRWGALSLQHKQPPAAEVPQQARLVLAVLWGMSMRTCYATWTSSQLLLAMQDDVHWHLMLHGAGGA